MNRNLQLLTTGVAVRVFGSALYSPFLALFFISDLHIGYLEIGTILVGVGLVQLPFNFLGGLLTDRWGRRRLILFGLATEALATAGLAYAFALRSLPGGILAALLGGSAASLAGPAFSAYIADFAEGSERTRGFTWYRIGFNAGFSAGVSAGGILASVLGFAGAVFIASLVIAVGFTVLLVSIGPSPVDVALAEGRALGSSRGGAGSSRANVRESFRILARDRPALEVLLAVGLAALVVGQWAVTFPLFVHNVLGISYSLLGVGLALNGLVVVFGQSPTTERVIGRRHSTIAILGLLLYVAAFLGLGAAGLVAFFPLSVFFLAVVVLTFGENLLAIPQTTLPSNLAPKTEVGAYNGAFNTVGAAGGLASVFVGTLVLSLTSNPLLIWSLLVLPAVFSVILFRDAARRMRPGVDRA